MKRLTLITGSMAIVLVSVIGHSAQALFHQWNFSEFFSNADGTVQFIELQCAPANNEHFASAGQIRSLSTGKVFDIPADLPNSMTANKFMFVATDGFESLSGAPTPDFDTLTPLPANFFNPAGDTISLVVDFFGTVDSRMFTSVPTDGVMSLNYAPVTGEATNSPTNYAGDSGAVNLSTPSPTGDYNGNGEVDAADYVVWQDTLNQTASPAGSGADGNANGTIDAGDYDFWEERFGNVIPAPASGAGTTSVPEPTAAGLISLGLALLVRRRRR